MRCLGLLDEFPLTATEVADSPRAAGKPPGRKASALSADASWEEVANAPLSVLAGVGPKREQEFAKFGLQRGNLGLREVYQSVALRLEIDHITGTFEHPLPLSSVTNVCFENGLNKP